MSCKKNKSKLVLLVEGLFNFIKIIYIKKLLFFAFYIIAPLFLIIPS